MPPQTINTSFKMKKSFLTFAITALVLSFTSCKETTVETTEETAVEVIETPVEEVETPVEVVVDSTSTDATLVEDNLNTASVE